MTLNLASLSPKEEAMDWLDQPDLQRMSDTEDLWPVIQHLAAQLDANPQDARAFFLRGNAYLDQRCFDLARDDYTCALELAPGDAITYNNRGIAYRSLGNPTRAIEDYRQALALDKTYRDAYNNLGLALSDLGEFEAAIQAYTQAITIDIHDWHAYNNRGLAPGRWGVGKTPGVTMQRSKS
jgi:tetratricopeptide (TPR) repeat protein